MRILFIKANSQLGAEIIKIFDEKEISLYASKY